jgi:hemerythrin-like metal-binding protein
MPMLEWNDDLSVKVAEVDEQHKKCVDMVNELYDSMRSGSSAETLLKIVDDMRNYTEFHFTTEEKFMEQHEFSGLQEHKQEHEEFIAKVVQVEGDCQSGKGSLDMEVLNFLSNWLVTHINDTDKKMGEFLASKGVS